MSAFEWKLRGRCYKLGDDIPHAGAVIPQWIIAGRFLDPEVVVPHLFEQIDPGFHERARPGDIIVAGRNFGMGPKMNGYVAMQALGLGLICESMPFLAYRAAVGCGLRVLTDCTGVTAKAEMDDLATVSGGFAARERLRNAVEPSQAIPQPPTEPEAET